MNNLDLAALIRCLEVMADENSWGHVIDESWSLFDPIEARPWDVSAKALELVRLQIAQAQKNIKDSLG